MIAKLHLLNYMKRVLFLFLLSTINFNGQSLTEVLDNNVYPEKNFIYDYSDPFLNKIVVNVWGKIKQPGKYILEENCSLIDLFNFVGGIDAGIETENIKIFRKVNSNYQINSINLSEIFSEKSISKQLDLIEGFVLQDGDIIVFNENVKLIEELRPYFTLISTLVSLGTLLYLIFR